MNRNANSPLSHSFARSKPSSSTHAVTDALRQSETKGNPIRFSRLTSSAYDNILGRKVSYEVAPARVANPKLVLFENVPGLKGPHTPVSITDSKVKCFKITVVDRKTGEPKEVLAKLEMREVSILSYGKVFKFSCKAGSQSVVDSRDGQRKPLAYVKAELIRLLGQAEGLVKFETLAV